MKTFEKLDNIDYYAKDKNTAYYKGKEIENADTASFEILGYEYARDKKSVYYKGKTAESIDVYTVKYIETVYVKDRKLVFYNGKIINEADTGTFEVLDPIYFSKDKNSVFFMGKKIKNADSDSFEVCGSNLTYESNGKQKCRPGRARDKNFIYIVRKTKYAPFRHLSKRKISSIFKDF